jgi:hypothetical protein
MKGVEEYLPEVLDQLSTIRSMQQRTMDQLSRMELELDAVRAEVADLRLMSKRNHESLQLFQSAVRKLFIGVSRGVNEFEAVLNLGGTPAYSFETIEGDNPTTVPANANSGINNLNDATESTKHVEGGAHQEGEAQQSLANAPLLPNNDPPVPRLAPPAGRPVERVCHRLTPSRAPRPRRYSSIPDLLADWDNRFEVLEVLKKNSWRKDYSASENKMFSRLLQVVKGVRSCVRRQDETAVIDPIEHLDLQFQELGCSIPKMIVWLQEKGHLTKLQRKSRGIARED